MPLTTATPRALAAAGVVVLVGTLLGCGPAASAPPTTAPPTTGSSTTSPSTSGTPSTPDPKADMRTRLADALRPTDPSRARVVADTDTRLTVVPTRWLEGWQVVDVLGTRPPHPQRFYVGLSSAGESTLLSGQPQGFTAMTQAAGTQVGSAGTATEVAQTWVDATRTFQRYAYRITSVDDIEWRTGLTGAQQDTRIALERDYRDRVAAPRPTRDGDAWSLHLWVVDGPTLVDHTLSVATDGTVTDEPRTVARDLPVPVTV